MRSRVNPQFWRLFAGLPIEVQRYARKAYALFRQDPYHKSLHFKLVGSREDIYSVRIGLHYRALCRMDENHNIVWFWIGTHAEYDKLISKF